ncbi:MAG: branched-chain amino acid ABC transporter permease [Betaproteobacteria bacterium]|jgi:branched-chain amino acid transport system permease protein
MKKNQSQIFYIALILFGIVAPWFFYPIFLMKILCFALFAAAFNLLLGYTGLLSFGHAAFLGGAGYICGYIIRDMGASPEVGLLGGTLFAALLGYLMGSLAIRRQGIYFAMITLALAQMLYFVFLQAKFTGGEDGMQGIPRGVFLGVLDLQNDINMYFVVYAFFLISIILIARVTSSPFGKILFAIKENEPRAISLGYDVDRFKLLAFILSGALAGLAGSLQALMMGFETLSDAHWSMSGLVILMALVGGVGTLIGPIIGAIVITVLEHKVGDIGNWVFLVTNIEWFRTLGESVTIVTGLIFVICVMAFRKGIVGEFLDKLKNRHN